MHHMEYTKCHYKAIKHNGYTWGGWLPDEGDYGLHFFVKGNNSTGFKEIKCTEHDLNDAIEKDGKTSFQFMADNHFTR